MENHTIRHVRQPANLPFEPVAASAGCGMPDSPLAVRLEPRRLVALRRRGGYAGSAGRMPVPFTGRTPRVRPQPASSATVAGESPERP